MATDPDTGVSAAMSADEAFSVLGHGVRLQILQTIGPAEEPLAFSEVFHRLDYGGSSSNFGYHIEQLVGQFVNKANGRYSLTQAGQRVVEAVLSGTVTENPRMEPTTIDRPCPFCSADVRVAFQQERVEMHCPECSGMGSGGYKEADRDWYDDHGNLGYLLLPPAGVRGRTAAEVLEAAERWTALQVRAASRGICPRCSAWVTYSTSACPEHAADDGRCDRCDHRFAALSSAVCTNCIFDIEAPTPTYLAVHTALMSFMIDHGVDPISPEGYNFPLSHVEETVHSADPFEGQFTFTAGDETLRMTVDNQLSVVDISRVNHAVPG